MSVTQTLSRSLAAIALTLLAVQAVNAAESKAKAKQSSTSADGIEQVSATDEAGDASPTQSATTAIETNTVSPVNTSTAGLAKAIQDAAPRKWFGEFYTETSENVTDTEHLRGTPKLSSYGGVKYDFGNARSMSVRQNFHYDSTDERGFGNFHVDDLAINYADGKLATFANDGTVILIGRIYLPTGETSRYISHQDGKARLYLFETKSFGKLDLTLVQLGQYFNWTQDSYFAGGEDNQSAVLAGTGEFDAFYNFTPAVSVGIAAGADAALLRPLAGHSNRSDDVYIQPTLQIIPMKKVTAQIYLYNEIDTREPKHSFALLRDDDNKLQYWANIAVSL
jgi:hypothetical protein